ncbi:hypothetical protein [Pseudomonas amygdali]|uniref:hypothetical protein n=1 Tax=Pseudomonas amygdali TaxID=47877 RepID=UPI00137AD57A|nr:hypothetical protein [Pseudomonas amygdali]
MVVEIFTGIIKHYEHMNAVKLRSATEQAAGDFGRDDGDVAAGLDGHVATAFQHAAFVDAASGVDQVIAREQIEPIGKARPLTERQEDHLTFKVMRLDKIDLLFF